MFYQSVSLSWLQFHGIYWNNTPFSINSEPISMMTMIACLVLVGIVVNNDIILKALSQFHETDGTDGSRLMAFPTGIPPILMASLTTIQG